MDEMVFSAMVQCVCEEHVCVCACLFSVCIQCVYLVCVLNLSLIDANL